MPLIPSLAVTPVAANVTRSEPSHTDISPSEFLIQTLLFSFHPEAKEIELSLPAQTTLCWGWGEVHIGKLSRFWTFWVAIFLTVPLAASDSWLVARATTKSCQLSVYLMFSWEFKHFGLPCSPPCQWHCNEVWQMPFENYFILWRFIICFGIYFSLCMWWDPLGTFDIWKIIIIALINYLCPHVLMCITVPWNTCGCHRTARKLSSLLPPCGIELRLPCLVASTFTR